MYVWLMVPPLAPVDGSIVPQGWGRQCRGDHWGGQGVGSGSCKSECLHGETREVVSNLVLGARYMRDANVEIV